ncbi:MAG: hypothetical protein ACK4MV_16420 [Beijerinckiaceae bacterium]
MSNVAIDRIRAETSSGTHRRSGIDIPPSWTGPHLWMRIRDHFDYWKRSPSGAIGGKAGFWPAYVHTKADINGYVNRDGVSEDVLALGDPYQDFLRAKNRRVVPLDGYEVRIRDTIQDFLVAFRQHDSTSCDLIEHDCRLASEGYGVRDRARAWGGMSKSTYDDARKRALNLCCAFLNERGKPVL